MICEGSSSTFHNNRKAPCSIIAIFQCRTDIGKWWHLYFVPHHPTHPSEDHYQAQKKAGVASGLSIRIRRL